QRLRLVRIGGVPAVAEEHPLAVFHGGVGARGMRWCVVEIVGGIVLPFAVETDRQLAFRRMRTEQHFGDRPPALLQSWYPGQEGGRDTSSAARQVPGPANRRWHRRRRSSRS